MFWRERDRETRDFNGGPPIGQVRVLVLGDSGVGKTSLVQLILNGSVVARPPQTIGCSVSVKHITFKSSTSSSNDLEGDVERDFFVELWDVCGHERYKDCRSLFYSQVNGIIFVYDVTQKRTKLNLQKWAAEVAASGTFSAPLASGGPFGLPVPYIVISNKADIAAKESEIGSSGNLVDAARQWVEKQGLLSSSEDLPLTASFPGNSALVAAAKEARFDKEAVMKFFHLLIRRRYFADAVPAPSSWSLASQRPRQHSTDILIDDDPLHPSTSRLSGNMYHNIHPPLPAQRNLPPPPTLYPQQPVSISENYSFPRIYQNVSSEYTYSKSKRTDIDV
ncbi:small GTPase LIP1-like isoform X1 [Amaranthus tricolor]|uniref:small GTPase LIP1-like isoform X1 n=1 Tax=Amaranthus tricolor TaxID=29722 RepID=UPI00258CCD11|nr:small GTPase LIP1-like isoform X1 [Amaranthus tricolor]